MDEKTIRESHTIREDGTIREDQTIRETAGTQKDQGITRETFRDYKIVRQLTTHGGEADAYIIEKEGQGYFLKLYRYGIQPKEEVLRKTYELSQSIPEHMVRIYEYGFDESWQRWYEVQEYVRLGNLKDYVLDRGLVGDVAFAKELVKELSSAIHSLHKRGIIHRDLKPQNILVRRERPFDIVLTDFGISSIVDSDVSKIMTTTKGTYAYSAPESFSGYFGKEVDWWAVGMIILEVMTGKNPLSGLSPQVIMHHLSTKAVPIAEDIPEDFKVLIKGLLARDPKKRWGYAQIKSWLEGKRDIPVYYEEGTKEYSLKEWLDAGFTEQGAKKWMEVVDDPQLAIKLKNQVGLTPEEAKKWISVGIINPYVISTWISAGFRNPEEVRIYEDLGLGPRQADNLRSLGYDSILVNYSISECGLNYYKLVEIGKWAKENRVGLNVAIEYIKELGYYKGVFEEIITFRDISISPNDAKSWKNAGFSSDEAKGWKDAGFSISEAKEWKNAGLSSKEAKEWKDAEFSLNEAGEWKKVGFSSDEAKGWKDAGFSISEAKEWKNAGFSLKEAKEWKDAEFSLIEAGEWKKVGFSSDEAKGWKDTGFSISEAKEWKDAGLSSKEAKEWKDAGFSLNEAGEWKKVGFSSDEAKGWKDAGLSSKEAKEWKDAGFSLNEAGEWKKVGFSSDEAKGWKDAGLSSKEAKEWKDAGFSLNTYKLVKDSWDISWFIGFIVGILFFWGLGFKISSFLLGLIMQQGFFFHVLRLITGLVFSFTFILITALGFRYLHENYTRKFAEIIRIEKLPPRQILYILLSYSPALGAFIGLINAGKIGILVGYILSFIIAFTAFVVYIKMRKLTGGQE